MSLYRWQLAAVSLLSLVVDRRRRASGGIDGAVVLRVIEALVAIGKRSYGVYLWSWPIIGDLRCLRRLVDQVHHGDVADDRRLGVLVPIYIETPIRKGALRRWFDRRGDTDWSARTMSAAVSAMSWSVLARRVLRRRQRRFDRAAGGDNVTIDVAKVRAPAADALTARWHRSRCRRYAIGHGPVRRGRRCCPPTAVAVSPAAADLAPRAW